MARRSFCPEDVYRLKTAADPDLSVDGRRVAWVQLEVDQEADRAAASIWVVPLDGSAAPRPFSEGPADTSPRWSPDGRWLVYVSAPDGQPLKAHLRLACLDGGAPVQIGAVDGPVSQPAWSPDSTRVAVVARLGVAAGDESTTARNAPRRVRGLAARLDGVGWQEGRRHIVVIDIASGAVTQLTQGEFDNTDPSWSPDGESVAFSSDRDRGHDDRQFRSDIWVVPAKGGRGRRLTNGNGRAAFPTYSPDGSRLAFAGHEHGESWNVDSRVLIVPLDASSEPHIVAPALDRGVVMMPGMPAPYRWTGNNEIALLVADRGAVSLHVANLTGPSTRVVVGGDRQIDGFAVGRGNGPAKRAVVFTASWPDCPSEVWVSTLRGDEARPLTNANEELLHEVVLSPLHRSSLVRPDGTEIEYFTLLPPGAAGGRAVKAGGGRGRTGTRGRPYPLHLEIHGGPHGLWPSGRFLAFHQALAAAGYVVVLPNPRGSTSYGQKFTEGCTGDWGGKDCDDILACCDDVVEAGIADRRRMFVSGGSYGGFMTSWIVGHSKAFRAATAMAAVIDQTSMLLTTEIPDFSKFNFGGTPWEHPDEYRKRSPLTYLPDVTTPVLIIHWEGDLRVPIGQGEELYAGLRLLGKRAEMLRFPGGFHIFRSPSQNVEWVKALLEWNERHDVKPDKPPRK